MFTKDQTEALNSNEIRTDCKLSGIAVFDHKVEHKPQKVVPCVAKVNTHLIQMLEKLEIQENRVIMIS